jgi:hypothetical protein
LKARARDSSVGITVAGAADGTGGGVRTTVAFVWA